jgi:excinuclease ABC subunit C
MKDDKNLAYLKLTRSPVPELIKTRQKFKDGWEYFGPYVSGVEESVRALRRIFRIRNCRVKFSTSANDSVSIADKAWKTIPCMDYYIWLCPAPCLLESSKIDAHNENIQKVQTFLSGESNSVFDALENEMRDHAREFRFEEAQKVKSTIEALRWLHERQKVRDIVEWDIDIFIKYEKYDKTYIWLTQIRWWKIIGVFRHEAILGADDEEDLRTTFLTRQYLDEDNLPNALYSASEIQDDAFLDFLKSKKIDHEVPKIGSKYELVNFTLNQVKEYAYKKELSRLENKTLTREHMVHVLEKLSYPVPKKWEIVFECYDISHTDGHFTYASRVVIVNGKPETSRYKKYKIKTLEDGDIDDFASHKEVMMRRTLEWLEHDNFPHLIIIDGGKGQLSSALSGIEEGKFCYNNKPLGPSSRTEWNKVKWSVAIQVSENTIHGLIHTSQEKWDDANNSESTWEHTIHTFPNICSIAKREEEIFLPWNKDPIMFEKWTGELMVLQKARDESHRFSITANKTARMKSMKKNILEELPWFGPVTRKKLLALAGSIDEIRNIGTEEIQKICTKAQIETLRDHGIIF